MQELKNTYNFQFKSGRPDYSQLKVHLDLINSFVKISKETVYIKDLYKESYKYMSFLAPHYSGFTAKELIAAGDKVSELVITDKDLDFVQSYEQAVYNFVESVPVVRRKHIVKLTSHQLLHKDGYKYSIFAKETPLLSDDKGSVWLFLGRIFLAPSKSKRYIYLELMDTGERYGYDQETKKFELIEKPKLTLTELKVLIRSNSGILDKELCDKLNISMNTIKTHKKNILKKLDGNNINDAYTIASIQNIFY